MKKAIAISCFLFTYWVSYGQLQPDFYADTTSFCPPRIVNFYDQSLGSGIIYRKWIFTPTSQSVGNNLQPSSSFVTPGKYTITLIVSNGIDTAQITKTNYIHVFAPPKAKFSYTGSLTGCAPIEVTFTNQSVPGDAPIHNITWTFGDNSPPQNSSPITHQFTQGGVFSINLSVRDTNGCLASKDSLKMVKAFAKPNAEFTSASSPHSCQPPLTVNLINNSTGKPPLTFLWDFGNGQTSTATNPTVLYQNAGVFDVSLIVSDSLGCADTLFHPKFASATATIADFYLPRDTFCVGENITLTNTSVGGGNAEWSFFTGAPKSNTWNSSISYNQPGSYNIKLKVWESAQCIDSVTKTIYIQKITAGFTVNNPYGCELVHYTNFTNYSDPQANWFLWSTSYSLLTSNAKNPVMSFNTFGAYSVQLIAQSEFGCSDTFNLDSAVYIYKLNQAFMANPPEGCVPLTVNFTDNSIPLNMVGHRIWHFGDGTTTTQPNPTKTYTVPGSYEVKLQTWTIDSCLFEETFTVLAGTKQVANFTIDTTIFCANDTNKFLNLSTDSSLINTYHWEFGDGQISSQFEPIHFFKDTGWLDISLRVGYNGCYDTLIKQDYVYVKGPIAEFSYVIDCDNPFVVPFQSIMKDVTRYYWDFGDLSPLDSQQINPIHQFTNTTNYTVTLYTFNDSSGCSSEFDLFVKIRNLKANFSISDSIACFPTTLQLNANPSQDELPGNYHWDVGGGFIFMANASFNHQYTQPGKHIITLVVSDENYCTDTVTKWVKLFKPNAFFEVDTNKGCVPFKPQFFDKSQSDTTLFTWQWTLAAGQNSNLPNPVGFYNPNVTKWFDVGLVVADVLGCTDTLWRPGFVQAIKPPLNLVASQQLCAGDSSHFENSFHQIGNTYYWDFGNGLTSTQQKPSTTYVNAGFYDILVAIADTNMCFDTTIKQNYIHVQAIPQPKFTATPRDSTCYPLLVTFIDTTKHSYIDFTSWNFGDDANYLNHNGNILSHNYLKPGSFDVSLVVVTTFGCTDTLTMPNFITIDGPYAQLILADDTVCTGQEAEFSFSETSGIFEAHYDFGDGIDSVSYNPDSVMKHIYQTAANLVVRVLIIDSAGNCPKYVEDTISIHHVQSEFSLNPPSGCIPHTVQFTNQSIGADIFNWKPLDSVSIKQTNTNYTYHVGGQYEAILIATDSLTGCTDTSKRVVDVFNLPTILKSPDATICKGDTLQVWATGGVNYFWNPFPWASAPYNDTTLLYPQKSMQFFVEVVNNNGCKNKATMQVKVQQPISFTMITDTVLYEGQTVNLWVQSSDQMQVRWFADPLIIDCPKCPTTNAYPTQSLHIPVKIADINGCFPIDTGVTIEIINQSTLFIPNAFTPNNDQLNDYFDIVAEGFKEVEIFQIFDRWGNLVFETTELQNKWDGKIKGEYVKQTTVFVYKLILVKYNNEKVVEEGFICLIK